MATEIEIKYLFPAEQTSILSERLSALGSHMGSHLLDNEYFDSDQQTLIQNRCALRIRRQYPATISLAALLARDGNNPVPIAVEQTLKTAGQEVQGIFQRREWNWPLANHMQQLDGQLLEQTEIKRHWPANLPVSELKAVFRTIFQRSRWLIEWQGYRFEAALDQGQVSAANKSATINELELEWLDQGAIADVEPALRDLGAVLARDIKLTPSSISKAHQGYRLLQSTAI